MARTTTKTAGKGGSRITVGNRSIFNLGAPGEMGSATVTAAKARPGGGRLLFGRTRAPVYKEQGPPAPDAKTAAAAPPRDEAMNSVINNPLLSGRTINGVSYPQHPDPAAVVAAESRAGVSAVDRLASNPALSRPGQPQLYPDVAKQARMLGGQPLDAPLAPAGGPVRAAAAAPESPYGKPGEFKPLTYGSPLAAFNTAEAPRGPTIGGQRLNAAGGGPALSVPGPEELPPSGAFQVGQAISRGAGKVYGTLAAISPTGPNTQKIGDRADYPGGRFGTPDVVVDAIRGGLNTVKSAAGDLMSGLGTVTGDLASGLVAPDGGGGGDVPAGVSNDQAANIETPTAEAPVPTTPTSPTVNPDDDELSIQNFGGVDRSMFSSFDAGG